MPRLGYFLMVVELMVLAQDVHSFCRRFNFTKVALNNDEGSFLSEYENLRNRLVTKDVSYLPEEDYVDEGAPSQNADYLTRDNRNLMPEYRNLCEIVTKRVQMTSPEYEYQPPHYHEIYCKSYSLVEDPERSFGTSKQKCAHPGFHCVQRSRTVFLVRRRWDSDCWEPFTKEIASGCDCMWPVSVLGDITAHY